MIITGSNPEVLVLKQIWDSAQERNNELVGDLRRRLMLEVLAPAIERFGGQLILKYQTFLSRVSNGNHSWAHGPEMVTKTVYWISVARLLGCEIEEVPEVVHRVHAGNRFVTPRKFCLPVLWECDLKPRYRRGVHRPYFVIGEVRECREKKFDISLLGHHLFRFGRSGLDWATEIEIAIGDESVGKWLEERKSTQTFEALCRK